MTKIAINTSFGLFRLSSLAAKELIKLGVVVDNSTIWGNGLLRDDPRLIQVIEKLGKEASHCNHDVKVVEIPDDVKDWYIHEYDGMEWICEGRTWGKDL